MPTCCLQSNPHISTTLQGNAKNIVSRLSDHNSMRSGHLSSFTCVRVIQRSGKLTVTPTTYQRTRRPSLRPFTHFEHNVPSTGDIRMCQHRCIELAPVHRDALDVRLLWCAARADHERMVCAGQVDCHLVEEWTEIRTRVRVPLALSPSGGDWRRDSRSDDIFSRYGVDGVEPERAEDVPRAHLATILVLKSASAWCKAAVTGGTYVPQRDH